LDGGIEARIFRNERLFVAMLFHTRREAVAWAEGERGEVEHYEWFNEVVRCETPEPARAGLTSTI
jgi:hypothetical protein